jgi:hypothetical protein
LRDTSLSDEIPPEIKAMVFFFIIKRLFCDLTIENRYAAKVSLTGSPDACNHFQVLNKAASTVLKAALCGRHG